VSVWLGVRVQWSTRRYLDLIVSDCEPDSSRKCPREPRDREADYVSDREGRNSYEREFAKRIDALNQATQ
jgi:hypothetical protein